MGLLIPLPDEPETLGNPNMRGGTFTVLVHSSPLGAVILELVDHARGMEFISEEIDTLGPLLDDCGGEDKGIEGAVEITYLWRGSCFDSPITGIEYDAEWVEVSRRPMKVVPVKENT